MIVFISSGEVIGAIVRNPELIIKSVVLLLTLLYAFFSVRVLVQIRRLERWLIVLRGYHFSIWAFFHVVLVIVGIVMAAVVL